MKLVTGRTGEPHVTSEQDRMLNQGVYGEEACILQTGRRLNPEVKTSNEIRIRDGAIVCQGALGCVETNTYDSVTIQNGNQGMNRVDLIVWRYRYDQEQDKESADWAVVQGTPTEGEAQRPDYTKGNIQEGDAVVEFPVYEVKLEGINITEVNVIAKEMPTIDELNRKFVFKRRNSSEAGICTPHHIMIMGTSVLQGANADYRQLFLASDLLSKLKFYDPSISNFDERKCVITTNNGDGNAAAIHFYAPEWWGSNNAYFQYFYPATSSSIRVNYCIHYLKL